MPIWAIYGSGSSINIYHICQASGPSAVALGGGYPEADEIEVNESGISH